MELSKIRLLYEKKDKMHDWKHIVRLRSKVNVLRKPYKKLNKDLLNFLILFHGLKVYVMENKKDFDKKYVQSLLRHNKNPIKIEEKIVFDANMLDNVGRRGIKKAIFLGRDVCRIEPETLRYLRDNLNKIKFYTKLGKRLGEKQIILMRKIIALNMN